MAQTSPQKGLLLPQDETKLTKHQLLPARDSRMTEEDSLRVQAGLRTLHAKLTLSEEDIAEAMRRASVKTISKGEVIMREGELSQFIVWIRSGQVAVHRHDRGLLCTLSSGFVGHHSYIYDKPRSATVIASGGPVSYIQLAVPRDGVVTEDQHELEREELEAMMLASSAMAASLVQEARDVASHVMSGEDALKDPNAELLQFQMSALERRRVVSFVQAAAERQVQWSVYRANVERAEELRRQCDAAAASVAELQQHKSDLVAAFADVASSHDSSGALSRVQKLQQLALDAKSSECMRGVDVSEQQQNYASKLLLAAIDDMRAAMADSLESKPFS